jgi:MjaI restriction endonuclease
VSSSKPFLSRLELLQAESGLGDPAIFVISNEEVAEELVGETKSFPKYTTQILNLCNQNAQGTRPSVVGQMSDLVQECPYKTYKEWKQWYLSEKPKAIDEATQRIRAMVGNLRTAIALIDDAMIKAWVEDLVIAKSFTGLHFQQAILSRVAKMKKTTFRTARPEEESKGIDGYVGQDSVSIKPTTYKSKLGLPESIRIPIIYYEKLKDGIRVDASAAISTDGKLG